MSEPIPVLEVSGTHQEVGRQIGEHVRSALHRRMPQLRERLSTGVSWEDMLLQGRTGYRLAAGDPHADRGSLAELYENAAEAFPLVRRALNLFSDRSLFPIPTSPVDRFLRQTADGFDLAAPE